MGCGGASSSSVPASRLSDNNFCACGVAHMISPWRLTARRYRPDTSSAARAKGAGSSCLTLAGPDSGSDHQIELPKSLARYATTMIVLIGLGLAIAIYYP